MTQKTDHVLAGLVLDLTLSEFSQIEGVDASFAVTVTPLKSLPLLVFELCVPTPESPFRAIDVLATPVPFSGTVVVCFVRS